MPTQRHDGDIDVRSTEPSGGRGEDAIARADGHALESFVHVLILQDAEESTVRAIRARPPEVASPRDGECDGQRSTMVARDDALRGIEARHGPPEGRNCRRDLVGGW